jgi:hypothetical protein
MRLYRTSNTTNLVLTQTAINAANGVYQYDYKLGDVMMSMDLTFIKTMYQWANLLGFNVQISIVDTLNLIDITSGLANYYVTQNTLPGRNAPDMGFISVTDPNMQGLFFALNNTITGNRQQWFSNPKVKRLTQCTRVNGMWHQINGFKGQYEATSFMTGPTTTIASLAFAPPTNEPHGFALCWFDSQSYPATATVTLQVNCSAVWQLRGVIPGV